MSNELKRTCELPGQAYHDTKSEFKKLLKKHGIKWRGTMQSPFWKGKDDAIAGKFKKDQEGVTQEALLTWYGTDDTEFYEEFREYCLSVGGKVTEQTGLTAIGPDKIDKLKVFEFDYDMEMSSLKSAPAGFRKAGEKEWFRKREKLWNKLGIEHTKKNCEEIGGVWNSNKKICRFKR